jgi:trehalose-phosphatase
MKYLFNEWDAVKDRIKGRYLFVFLDFDGTLVPIALTPDKAILPQKVKGLLKSLADNPRLKLAIISGRAIEDLKDKIGLKNVIYSGNHGLEIEGPKISFKPVVSSRYRIIIERIKNDLGKMISSIPGAFIEDKGLSLSLHYRLVDKNQIPLLKTAFHEAVILFLVRDKIRIKPGKMVLEVRPPVEWDKGKVVLWLLGRQIFALKKENILPIYIGDDVTDEDAFKALRNKGLTIFVGERKDSRAKYYLNDQTEVAEFLKRIYEVLL